MCVCRGSESGCVGGFSVGLCQGSECECMCRESVSRCVKGVSVGGCCRY